MSEINMQNPFQQQFEALLKSAIEKDASDIHFEPYEKEIRIRIRVDASLEEISSIADNKFRNRFFEHVKKSCGFDMGIMGEPQDVRFSNAALECEFRGSLMPVIFGEKIVLRIIPRNKAFSLGKYGLPDGALIKTKEILGAWQGLILTSGPTSSGKTTLLYSMLSEIDKTKNNICTIEDPIEFTIPGINQTQIDRKKGVTFEHAVRTAMRQDPDVILIGEIRDKETAAAAVHAAQTGHLVLSTVHANSAQEVMSRLVGLGIDRDTLIENLLFVSAQRLGPKLCNACFKDDFEGKRKLEVNGVFDVFPKITSGCEACGGRGEKGKVLLFEYIHFENEDKKTKDFKTSNPFSETSRKYLQEGLLSYENASCFL